MNNNIKYLQKMLQVAELQEKLKADGVAAEIDPDFPVLFWEIGDENFTFYPDINGHPILQDDNRDTQTYVDADFRWLADYR